ncbi:hypothetical protein INH39_21330 [Massilia violaceinigra]|uniref:DUF6484 domain-containing protein n=1 Tax=Massilia violaceinigra TaxID=2045208 RepID=A0ABY3ZZU7_9BURK|nr:DUF6484 domain-containing protein [Massilia violaceinigra]UOD28010.1 hypothetical protein INH39_21330 [Massilia violaceinigra]
MMTVANPPRSIDAPAAKRSDAASAPGIVIGTLAGFDAEGAPLVHAGGRPAIAALTLVELGHEHIGARVALQFEGASLGSPVVMGIVRAPRATGDRTGGEAPPALAGTPLLVSADDEDLVLVAHRRITLVCGAASITLDAQGNIEIRGKHILSRAAGQNRIKGASVSLN